MFSLFRYSYENSILSHILTTSNWYGMEQHIYENIAIDERIESPQVLDKLSNRLQMPKQIEVAFYDDNDCLYVMYLQHYIDNYEYNEYDDYDNYCDRYSDISWSTYCVRAAERRRQDIELGRILSDPELIIRKYYPPFCIKKADRQNRWYVGALN